MKSIKAWNERRLLDQDFFFASFILEVKIYHLDHFFDRSLSRESHGFSPYLVVLKMLELAMDLRLQILRI